MGIETALHEHKGAAVLNSDGMADTGPLRNLLRKYIDQAFLDEVAAEYAKGRELWISTTNIDSRKRVIWNMTKLAAGKHPHVDGFDTVFMRALFSTGYDLSAKGYAWHKEPPGFEEEFGPLRWTPTASMAARIGSLPASFEAELLGAGNTILWHLDLLPEGRYQLRKAHLGQPAPNRFDDIGRWAFDPSGRIVLRGGHEASAYLMPMDRGAVLQNLAIEGGCHAAKDAALGICRR